MWMMGCNGRREFEVHDSFNGRKLRPLVPRHIPSLSSTSSANPPSFSSIHGHDFFGQLHHFTNPNEESKRELNNNGPQVVVSSRWNPTPEQLRSLEELYRRGTRTPSAEQIQHITSQLRRYGKIEGKNVFYWFQNHKARERQKRRRQMESSLHHQDVQILQTKDSGTSTAVNEEDEQIKNRPHSSNCSALAEESMSTQRTSKGSIFTDWRRGGRIQEDEGELQRRKNLAERHSTWQMIQISPPPLSHPNQLINTSKKTSYETARKMDPDFIKTHDFNVFMAPPSYRQNGLNNEGCRHESSDQSETLELFPLHSGDFNDDNNGGKVYEVSASAPYQFFEFLPLKN